MALRLIEISAPAGHLDTIKAIADCPAVIQQTILPTENKDVMQIQLLTRAQGRQRLLDNLQRVLGGSEGWRILLLPVDSSLPMREQEEEEDEKQQRQSRTNQTREELYNSTSSAAALTTEFVLMTVLAAIVAAVGLITDNTAAVIGAMVIAPLLSPNIALALGAALGNSRLLLRGLQSLLGGIAIAVVLGMVVAHIMQTDSLSRELSLRVFGGLDSVVLALAAGAAAAMALTGSTSMTMVGVMVAVALLPPAVTVGIVLGMGRYRAAAGATGLLVENVASVILAAQAVFYYRGIRPKSWLEQRVAGQSSILSVAVWLALLTAALAETLFIHPS